MSLSAQDKLRSYIKTFSMEAAEDIFYDFLYTKDLQENVDDYRIENDGSIYWRTKGRYVTETELEEFVSWAERENA